MLRKNIRQSGVVAAAAAVIAGLLTAFSFPDFNYTFLAWISFTPLIFLAINSNPKKSFILGILSGTVCFSIILYWLVPTFSAAGEYRILGIISLLLLSIYLSCYTGLFCFILSAFFNSSGKKWKVVFFAPMLWVSLELLRTYFLSGFPWALVGYSQWKFLKIIQISDITGVYGVSFLVILVNAFAAFAINSKFKKILFAAFPVSAFLLFAMLYGSYAENKYNKLNVPGDRLSFKAAILQGNIDQYKKWDKTYSEEILSIYEKLAAKASVHMPDIIVWPESSLPGALSADRSLRERISRLCKKTRTYHLIGAVDFRGNEFFNSALLLDTNGKILNKYDKIHLVVFGETIPFKKILGKFVNTFNEIGEISRGTDYTVFSVQNKNRSITLFGTGICFESLFPDIPRNLSKNGSSILFNLTNDAWYLQTSAPQQHFIFNVFRAIENRRPLLRAANTGISGEIDAAGRIIKRTGIFVPAVIISEVNVPRVNPVSFYMAAGDIFSYVCLLLTVILFLTK